MTARPHGYPPSYEGTVRLEDGRSVRIRPVLPEDVDQLASAIATADPETLRRRFLGGAPPHSREALLHLVTLDYVRRFAVAAFDDDGAGVGIARYEGERTWPAVDVAVVVDPAWRGVGLGRALVRTVVRRAVELGAEWLTADFYDDNQRVQGLLAEAALPERRTVANGVVEDQITLTGPDLETALQEVP